MGRNRVLIQTIWALIAFSLLLGGILLLIIFFLPFDTLKAFADSLSKDGNVETLTLSLFIKMSLPMRLLGFVLLTAGIATLINRENAEGLIHKSLLLTARSGNILWSDLQTLITTTRPKKGDKGQLYTLLGITLFALLTRIVFISKPMGHDEAYTIVTFAFARLQDAVSDYHLPNNHIFHTLLVYVSHHLFGIQPWAVRLPALIAGVLIVPACYLLARILYDKYSALLSAGLAAFLPLLIYYSVIARGYSLLTLITILIFILGIYVKENKNTAAWILLVMLSALGFYTMPTMLYPFGALITWLFLSVITKDIAEDYGSKITFILYLFMGGIATVILTLVLYSPVFVKSGAGSVIENPYVRSLDWDYFVELIGPRIIETWGEWNIDVSKAIGVILLSGFLSSLLFHKRISTHNFPTQLATVIWIGIVLAVQRPNPWARIWTYLLPLFLIWASAGIIGLLKNSKWKLVGNYHLDAVFSYIGLLALMVWSLIRTVGFLPCVEKRTSYDVQNPTGLSAFTHSLRGEDEEATIFLKDILQKGDHVAVDQPDDAPLWYYFRLYDIPIKYFNRIEPFRRVLVLVNSHYGQTISSVIEERGPDPFFFDLDSAKLLVCFGDITIYELIPDIDLINKVYGVE